MIDRAYDLAKFLALLNVSLIGALLVIDEKNIYFKQYEWLPGTNIVLFALSFIVAVYCISRSLDKRCRSARKYLKFAALMPCAIVLATLLKLT